MEPMNRPSQIIDYCLAPLRLDRSSEAAQEVTRRLEHVLRTFQLKMPQPVSVDFTRMPPLVINEAAHGID